jgi:hypothetical protein
VNNEGGSNTVTKSITISSGTQSPSPTTLYFPQFADGLQGSVVWGTVIFVTNPAGLGTPAATGTITLTQDDGTPMNVPLVDYYGAAAGNTFQLAGGQTKFFQSAILAGGNPANVGPLKVGFATVTSNLPVTASLVFVELSQNGISAAAGVPAATPLSRQAVVFVKNNDTNTGVALANPQTAAATITFQLVDGSGAQIAPPVTRTLAQKNHTAFFVSDLFPSAPAEIWGQLRITSDQSIVSTPLLFIPGGQFTTVPIFPLPWWKSERLRAVG